LKEKISPFLRRGADIHTQSWDNPALSSSQFPPIEGIDVQEGLKRLCGNSVCYKNLLIRFRENNQSTVDGIQSAINIRDYGKIRFLAHALKGVSGNLGMKEVYKNSEILEKKVDDENEDEIMIYWENLSQSLSRISDAIAVFESRLELPIKDTPASRPLDLSVLGPGISELAKHLRGNNLGFTDSFQKIRDELALACSPEEFSRLEKSLRNYDFEHALEYLSELAERLKITL